MKLECKEKERWIIGIWKAKEGSLKNGRMEWNESNVPLSLQTSSPRIARVSSVWSPCCVGTTFLWPTCVVKLKMGKWHAHRWLGEDLSIWALFNSNEPHVTFFISKICYYYHGLDPHFSTSLSFNFLLNIFYFMDFLRSNLLQQIVWMLFIFLGLVF